MDKTVSKISNIFVLIGMGLFFVLVALGTADVFNRIVVGSSLTFCQQSEVWVNLFLVFIIAPVLVLEDTHIGVKFIIDKLKGITHKIIVNLNYLALIGFCVITIWAGLEYVLYSKEAGTTRAMGTAYFPYWIITLALPVGMFFMLIASIYVYSLTFRKKEGK